MKRPRPLPAGPVKELRRRTQRTTPSTAQPNRVMVELRTMHTELFMPAAVSQQLCAIKSKFGASPGQGAAKTKRRVNDGFGSKIRKAQTEHKFSALLPATDIRRRAGMSKF
jgi:hypothetical protein